MIWSRRFTTTSRPRSARTRRWRAGPARRRRSVRRGAVKAAAIAIASACSGRRRQARPRFGERRGDEAGLVGELAGVDAAVRPEQVAGLRGRRHHGALAREAVQRGRLRVERGRIEWPARRPARAQQQRHRDERSDHRYPPRTLTRCCSSLLGRMAFPCGGPTQTRRSTPSRPFWCHSTIRPQRHASARTRARYGARRGRIGTACRNGHRHGAEPGSGAPSTRRCHGTRLIPAPNRVCGGQFGTRCKNGHRPEPHEAATRSI